MHISSSYGVEIRKQNVCIRKTMDIYRQAVLYLVHILDQAWEELSLIADAKKRFNTAEHLVHTTKKNTARYDFDLRFPKMPSYLRRSAVQAALGLISSCHTRAKGGRVVLPEKVYAMPVFYRKVMYEEGEPGSDTARIKLYDGHDWVFREIRLKHTDMEYLRRHWSGEKASAPILEKKHKKYFMRFTFKEQVSLTDKPADSCRICSVDLGINTDAVCTIMDPDGTILARRFINFPGDKDRIGHVLGRIRKHQRIHGGGCRGLWRYAVRLNEQLSIKTAAQIVRFAKEHHADVLVFEFLEMKGRVRGSKKMRLHIWRKRDVQKRCEHMAHRSGIRISRVCAWQTSRLAYDGSGKVVRDPGNHSLCTFTNGKQYNCDLSAAYNIGARYFIREQIKTMPETVRSLLEAKVPAVMRRSSCVYADLLEMQKVSRQTHQTQADDCGLPDEWGYAAHAV